MSTKGIKVRIGAALLLSAFMVAETQAIVGRPLSPVSVAGVARRTAVRTTAVVTTSAAASASVSASQQQAAAAQQQAAAAQQQAAAAQAAFAPGTTVSALPSGCTSVVIKGVDYFNCAGTYYRAAFKSNNIVFVVSTP